MGRYVPALCFLNLGLLISSTACLYLGSILINIYLLPSLELLTSHFATVPYLILAIGGLLALCSIIGIIAAVSKSRVALIVYAVLLGAVFTLQLASIFTSMELRNDMERRVIFQTGNGNVHNELKRYWDDETVRTKWDTLQRDFQCCGAFNMRTGFQDWSRLGNYQQDGQQRGVPNSCCLDEEEGGCGNTEEIYSDPLAYEKINIHGCMAIMKNRLLRDIAPVLLTYIACAVVLALITILAMVLSAAYVAAITRRSNQERDGMGMYQAPAGHNAGTSRYEDTTLSRPYPDTLDSGININGSLRSIRTNRSNYQDGSPHGSLHGTPIIKGDNHRASLYIEPSNEAGTVI
eukprot:GFUD01041175.1.p1 GENE.GFUD01041175.1~~GFUD01041175.1.p1  ORF type:complete len:348 (+),score=73.44 GFUD01041175.1:136-1179(+)